MAGSRLGALICIIRRMKIFAFLSFAALLIAPAAAQTDFIKPQGLAPGNGYSHVVVVNQGKLVYIAGQVARDKDEKLVGKGDLKAQATQVFENLKTALTAAGATFDDVVKINIYVKDFKPEMVPTLREVRDGYINKNSPPASTLVGVTSLAQEDYLIEVEAVAALPAKQSKKK
jgi:enamine deaminase RidA (YjgF/YER057c/UK114 family)